jgi:hypothetical protein
MQTQQTTPLAPYGSMNYLALVAKVGDISKVPDQPTTTYSIATRTVVRRVAAQ